MPNCRQCGARLSKFDADICPVCGLKHPFDDAVSADTVEFTQTIGTLDGEVPSFKSRKLAAKLAFFTSFLGLDLYYLHFYIAFVINAIYFVLLGVLLPTLLTIFFGAYYVFFITLGVSMIGHIAYGVYLLVAKDYKDGRGEFLR